MRQAKRTGRRKAAALSAVAALLLGGGASAGEPPGTTTPLRAEVFNSWTSSGEAAAVKVIADEFERRGGKWESSSVAGYESALTVFMSRVMADDVPTVAQFVVGRSARELIDHGILDDIDPVATAMRWNAVLPQPLIDAITVGGHYYLAPVAIHGENWIFFSKPVLRDAGIDTIPTTWDEFFADMDRLKARGIIPIAWGGQSWQELKVFDGILLSQLGIDGYMKIYRDKDVATIRSAKFRRVLQLFGRLRDYVDPAAEGRNWNDATAMLIAGKAGVQFIGDWAKGEFSVAHQVLGRDYGFAMPPETDAMVYIGDAMGFPRTGKPDQEAAQKLMAEVVLDPGVQVRFSILKGSIPARTDVDATPLDDCAKAGLAYLAAGKIVPDQGIIMTPYDAGTVADLVGEYWSDPSMTPDRMVALFAQMLAES